MSELTQDTLFSYFYERVCSARDELGTDVEDHTEHYLVNLLVEFLTTRRLVESGGRRVDELPLAIRLLESRVALPGDRYRELKHLGDTTLYVLGFFAESLRRSTVDQSYFIGVGESAYYDLASLPGGVRRRYVDPVFRVIADKFEQCVQLIAGVRRASLWGSSDLRQLFRQYLSTGDERIAERLRELGALLPSRKEKPDKILH